MVKTKIILVLVFLLSIMPIYSKPISFRMKGAFQRGCPRMPSITKVEADYEGEDIAVNIQKYSGTVWICIYDVDGNLVSSIADTITKNGFITQNVANLPTGEYTLCIALTLIPQPYSISHGIAAKSHQPCDFSSSS